MFLILIIKSGEKMAVSFTEGGLSAPTRHAIRWKEADFFNK